MRIIKKPPIEIEQEIECPECKALLGYTSEDIYTQLGISGRFKYIDCAYCYCQIRLEFMPYQKQSIPPYRF